MNTAEITKVVDGTDELDPRTVTGFRNQRKTEARAAGEPWLRHASFAVIVALLVGLALTLHNRIRDLETQIEVISAQVGPSYF